MERTGIREVQREFANDRAWSIDSQKNKNKKEQMGGWGSLAYLI
jgi:hypothetical protein